MQNENVKTNLQSIIFMIKKFMDTYYDVTMSTEKLKAWSTELSAYPTDQIGKAFKSYLTKNRNFPPNLAGIIAELCQIQKEETGQTEEQSIINAENAWLKVMDAVHYIGCYGTPDFENKAVHNSIMRLGGWLKICNSTESELPWLKKEFLKNYQSCFKYSDSLENVSLGNTDVKRLVNGYWEDVPEETNKLTCTQDVKNRWLKYLEDYDENQSKRPPRQ